MPAKVAVPVQAAKVAAPVEVAVPAAKVAAKVEAPAKPAVVQVRGLQMINLLVRIHFIIEVIWWTGLAPWEFG